MNEKTSVISFRIDAELKTMLEKESQMNHTTTNNLLNNIVRKHVKWDRFAQETGLVFISKPIFRNILVHINENELKILASSVCRSTLRDATMFLKGSINFQNLLETVDLWLENSHIPFRRFTVNTKHEKYIIQHDLGKKYSSYLYTAISTLFSEIGCTVKKEDLEEQTLDFEIISPSDIN
ncbi:MAG: hypothetical protein WD717_04380 [Nitrosarchaeum sp.]